MEVGRAARRARPHARRRPHADRPRRGHAERAPTREGGCARPARGRRRCQRSSTSCAAPSACCGRRRRSARSGSWRTGVPVDCLRSDEAPPDPHQSRRQRPQVHARGHDHRARGARSTTQQVAISVTDTGCGIAASRRPARLRALSAGAERLGPQRLRHRALHRAALLRAARRPRRGRERARPRHPLHGDAAGAHGTHARCRPVRASRGLSGPGAIDRRAHGVLRRRPRGRSLPLEVARWMRSHRGETSWLRLLVIVLLAGRERARCASTRSCRSWDPAAFRDLDTLEFLTVGPEEGPHWSTVWLVVLDDHVYVRLGSRAADRMQQQHDDALRVTCASAAGVRARAGRRSEPAMAARVADAMGEKYIDRLFDPLLVAPARRCGSSRTPRCPERDGPPTSAAAVTADGLTIPLEIFRPAAKGRRARRASCCTRSSV